MPNGYRIAFSRKAQGSLQHNFVLWGYYCEIVGSGGEIKGHAFNQDFHGFLKCTHLSLQVADIHLASEYTAYAISGPTVQGGLPVFRWNRFNDTLHQGMPEVYNFDFITMKPILKPNVKRRRKMRE